jgi:hypothetical protein
MAENYWTKAHSMSVRLNPCLWCHRKSAPNRGFHPDSLRDTTKGLGEAPNTLITIRSPPYLLSTHRVLGTVLDLYIPVQWGEVYMDIFRIQDHGAVSWSRQWNWRRNVWDLGQSQRPPGEARLHLCLEAGTGWIVTFPQKRSWSPCPSITECELLWK